MTQFPILHSLLTFEITNPIRPARISWQRILLQPLSLFLLSSPVPDRSDEALPADQGLRLRISDHEEMSVSGAKNIST